MYCCRKATKRIPPESPMWTLASLLHLTVRHLFCLWKQNALFFRSRVAQAFAWAWFGEISLAPSAPEKLGLCSDFFSCRCISNCNIFWHANGNILSEVRSKILWIEFLEIWCAKIWSIYTLWKTLSPQLHQVRDDVCVCGRGVLFEWYNASLVQHFESNFLSFDCSHSTSHAIGYGKSKQTPNLKAASRGRKLTWFKETKSWCGRSCVREIKTESQTLCEWSLRDSVARVTKLFCEQSAFSTRIYHLLFKFQSISSIFWVRIPSTRDRTMNAFADKIVYHHYGQCISWYTWFLSFKMSTPCAYPIIYSPALARRAFSTLKP